MLQAKESYEGYLTMNSKQRDWTGMFKHTEPCANEGLDDMQSEEQPTTGDFRIFVFVLLTVWLVGSKPHIQEEFS